MFGGGVWFPKHFFLSVEISGGSMNFARSFGPALVAWTFDLTKHAWAFIYCYAIAPLVGASLAAGMK